MLEDLQSVDKMKNVIIISQGREVTGVNKYATNLQSAFPDSSMLYFLKFRNEHGDYSIGETIYGKFHYGRSIFNLNSVFYRTAFSRASEMLKDFKKSGSIVHVASPHVLPVVPDFDNIVTIHDVFPLLKEGKKSMEEKLIRRFYKHYLKYDRILTVTNHVKKTLEGMGVDRRIDTIYPSISDRFRKLEDKKHLRELLSLPDKKLILSLSTNIPRKNLKVLPEIMERLGAGYRLVRVGDPLPGSINIRAENEEKLNMIYNACDILISPSLDEGFGYPVAEGLKAGIGLVLSDIPVHREVAGRCANFFDTSDISGAAKAIKDLESFSAPNVADRHTLIERFNPDRYKKNMSEYYQE